MQHFTQVLPSYLSLSTLNFSFSNCPLTFSSKFSFCTPPGPSAEGNDCGAWNDTSTADATYYAIQSWLQRYPEYRKTDMFIMGESYAGVYVPMIVKNILAGNDDGHSTDESHIRLKGFGVGDACTPPDICGSKTSGPFFQIQFLYGKSAFSNKLYEEINSVCSTEELKNGYLSDECAASVDKIDAEVGGYWAYGFYDACWYENDIRRALAVEGEGEGEGKSYRSYRKIIDVTKYQRKTETEGASVGEREYYGPPIATSSSRNRNTRRPMVSKTESVDVTQIGNDVGNDVGNDLGNDVASVGFIGGNGYACGGPTAQVEWLSRPEVMQALNIPSDGNFFQCDNGEDFTYTLSEMDLISWYKEIIAQNKLRILVYNGDTDPCINSYQAQNWTRNLGFEEVQSWRPWTLDGCQSMAGYITRYENNFDFLTIRGSGHMVPQDRPQVALSFLTKFLEGVDYPHYDTSCTGGVKN